MKIDKLKSVCEVSVSVCARAHVLHRDLFNTNTVTGYSINGAVSFGDPPPFPSSLIFIHFTILHIFRIFATPTFLSADQIIISMATLSLS